MPENDGQKKYNMTMRDALVPLIKRIGAHLNAPGIVDQIQKMRNEGVPGYFAERFKPYLDAATLAVIDIEERYSYIPIADGYDLFLLKTQPVNSEEEYRVQWLGSEPNEIHAEALCLPNDTKVRYFVSDSGFAQTDLKSNFRSIHRIGEIPLGCLEPPNSDFTNGLAIHGVARINEGIVQHPLIDFRIMKNKFSKFHGIICVGDDGRVEIVNPSTREEVINGNYRPPLDNGWAIQANYLVTEDNLNDFVLADNGLSPLCGLAKFYFRDGSSRLAVVSSKIAGIRHLGQLANNIKDQLGAETWEIAGVENTGDGMYFMPLPKLRGSGLENVASDRGHDILDLNGYEVYTIKEARRLSARKDVFVLSR